MVTTATDTVRAEPLPQGWSAQRAELCALVRALRYARGRRVNIYTDSKHAFAPLHVHGTIYKERGLLTAGGNRKQKQRRDPTIARGSVGTIASGHPSS